MLDLKPTYSGKVRDIYVIDDRHMLMVASDRLSAFDVILPDLIPQKGQLLTALSNFWFKKAASVVATHCTDLNPKSYVAADKWPQFQGRSVVVKRLRPLPIEAIVRGYLAGSGWQEYQKNQSLAGVSLPKGMLAYQLLPQPCFTPSTKAEAGAHDENISFHTCEGIIGVDLAKQVRDVSIKLYQMAHEYAASVGMLIADTKFEFGLNEDNQLVLMDEILTPDSSRFWSKADWVPGTEPPSFDKQFVRNWLLQQSWDKKPPAPELPNTVIMQTQNRYQEAYERITQQKWNPDT